MLLHSDLVYVKRVPGKGRGVFARRPIPEGSVIEKVPCILVALKQVPGGLENPVLARYSFIRTRETVGIALGFGSLYNHSYRPNARYDDGAAATLIFTALRDIQPDEEITINYNGDPKDKSSVGFEVH